MIWARWFPPEASNYAELVSPCRDYVYLGEINEEELNRLNFELKELSSMMADSQDEDTQNEVEVGVAINRGTSGEIKVLSGTIMIVGSVAGIAAVAASGGTALPVVVMALGTAMIMFGASDTIEGIGDTQAAISRQGLDKMSYNPVRESVFNGNETVYALTETGVSLAFDVITGMAIAKMPTRLKTPAQAFRATSTAEKVESGIGEINRVSIITKNGIKIEGFTRHGMHRSIGNGFDRMGVRSEGIYDALINPLKIKEPKTDMYGRISQRFLGREAEVVVNPGTGKIVSVNPISSSKLAKLLREKGIN